MEETDELVQLYFRIGFTKKYLICWRVISLRTPKRLCKKLHLYRRKNHTDLGEIVRFIKNELAGSGLTFHPVSRFSTHPRVLLPARKDDVLPIDMN